MTDPMAAQQALNQAAAWHQQGDLARAEAAYRQVLALDPTSFAARHMLGVLTAQKGQPDAALVLIAAALAANPRAADAWANHGNVLTMLGRSAEAVASYDRALALQPRDIETLYNRGNLLSQMQQPTEALESYGRLLALAPNHAGALNNLGAAQMALGRTSQALAAYDRALALQPDLVAAWNNRAGVLTRLRRFDEALAGYDRSLALRPGHAETLTQRAGLLLRLKRYREAADCYAALRVSDPGNLYALGGLMVAALNLCDWDMADALEPDIRAAIESGSAVLPPFLFLGYSDDKALQRACAARAVRDVVPETYAPLWDGTPYRHDRIRIAYISSDFCQHPVPALIAAMIEAHDRTKFEVLGISTGLDDGSEVRARIVKAFDQFQDVQGQSPATIAAKLRALEVDILIDLNGHTDGDNFDVLARRPCPLQVEYLGYPGTTGAETLDYVLTDPVVAPLSDQPFFSEQIAMLPEMYFPTSYGPVAPPSTRAEAGLPPRGIVYGCFNNSWKIRRPQFDVWMRLLKGMPGSVLWLLAANDDFQDALRREAQARGINPDRLIFAPRVTPQENLSRQQLADVMLDTLPYTGHMTASDALWAGVPLVTLPGKVFASRVAASLLTAMGLPELVAKDLADYEAIALKLARDAVTRTALREKMAALRDTSPAFDAVRLCRHVEQAYQTMWQRQQDGLPPQAFAVPRLKA